LAAVDRKCDADEATPGEEFVGEAGLLLTALDAGKGDSKLLCPPPPPLPPEHVRNCCWLGADPAAHKT